MYLQDSDSCNCELTFELASLRAFEKKEQGFEREEEKRYKGKLIAENNSTVHLQARRQTIFASIKTISALFFYIIPFQTPNACYKPKHITHMAFFSPVQEHFISNPTFGAGQRPVYSA